MRRSCLVLSARAPLPQNTHPTHKAELAALDAASAVARLRRLGDAAADAAAARATAASAAAKVGTVAGAGDQANEAAARAARAAARRVLHAPTIALRREGVLGADDEAAVVEAVGHAAELAARDALAASSEERR